ncbi:hypothetical protein [Arenimonas sp. MALMAid1274]|uniref:hypothetical protein n=1 Tax=Arenimonas sp. MALMAid1274 TaxID=3411630 RepID=UPI003BA08ED2
MIWLAGCALPPVPPDELRDTSVLEVPVLVSAPSGEHLVLLAEQSLQRTEVSHRTSMGFTRRLESTHSVIRDELWSFDPVTLELQWRRTLREYRPTGRTRPARLLAARDGVVWWHAAAAAAEPAAGVDAMPEREGAIAVGDGADAAAAGLPPSGLAWPRAAGAVWQLHDGPPNGEGGALRLPGSEAVLRAQDPAGYFHLHVTGGGDQAGARLRVERRADDGRTPWTRELPFARLHALAANATTLVFHGSTDGGKVPGTGHDAPGRTALYAIDRATGEGRVRFLDEIGLAPPASVVGADAE